MEKSLTAQSFIVRIYRTDTEDAHKIAGLVEALDGSGRQTPFPQLHRSSGIGRSASGFRAVKELTRNLPDIPRRGFSVLKQKDPIA